jgi:hypothetical protein
MWVVGAAFESAKARPSLLGFHARGSAEKGRRRRRRLGGAGNDVACALSIAPVPSPLSRLLSGLERRWASDWIGCVSSFIASL